MPINISQAFKRTSAQPIDETIALTKADMLTVNDNLMPAYYFTICQDDGKIYLYDKTATASATTGKFKEFSGGSGGSEVFSTTETLSDEINDTTTVLAADLPGVSFSDITVGITLIRDDKGTVGLVTAKNGTTDVTVTTATTSTPTKELTQAEYDALTEAEKKNGTIYFITDNYVGSTYVGAYDTIYSTTERVVGSYMGKPLYQKTLVNNNATSGRVSLQMGTIPDTDTIFITNGFYINASSQMAPIGDSLSVNTSGRGIGVTNLQYASYATVGKQYGVQVYYGESTASSKTVITVQYTKTTDTTSPVEYASPNDYSTSEKIVGTWIDGKPIYQKTIDCGALPSGTYKDVPSGITNVKRVISFEGYSYASGDNRSRPVQIASGDTAAAGVEISYVGDTNSIRLNSNTPWGSWGYNETYVTIKYTKTS